MRATSILKLAILTLALFAVARCSPVIAATTFGGRGPIVLDSEVQSKYSLIRLKRQGDVRMMIFVRDNGVEVIQTVMNMKKPYEPLAAYCRSMFATYLFQPQPKRILIVGLGGGTMVQFFQHYDPDVKVDAVEIDPEVVKAAADFFGTREAANTRILTEDAFHYFKTTDARYDVIYMDAFLKPAPGNDAVGVPLRLKTADFYKSVQEKLNPGGVIAINLNAHTGMNEDISTIKSVFGQTNLIRGGASNYVVIASSDKTRPTPATLRDRAKEADRRLKTNFSFQDIAANIKPPPKSEP